MMQKLVIKVVLCVITLGLVFSSCSSKAPEKQQNTDEPAVAATDTTSVAEIDSQLKAHQEDIQALWEISFGEDKKMAKYAVADGFVFLASEDGKQGLLLYFYKDDKDEDNFDGIAVEEGQQLAFQGDAIVMTEKGEKGNMTTYFEDSEHEGFYQLFTVTEKDGKKTYTDEMEEPFDEKQALSFLEEVNKAKASPLSENLGEWNKL